MPLESLDSFFDPVKPILTELHQLAQRENISVIELVFRFVAGNLDISFVVVGM